MEAPLKFQDMSVLIVSDASFSGTKLFLAEYIQFWMIWKMNFYLQKTREKPLMGTRKPEVLVAAANYWEMRNKGS